MSIPQSLTKRIAPVLAALLVVALLAAPDLSTSAYAASPAPSAATEVNARSNGLVTDSRAARVAMVRAMTSRTRSFAQHFTLPTSIVPGPADWATARTTVEILTIKSEADYQRKCDAADPAVPPRVERVRGPVSPGIVVQIAGDCFGSATGKVELVGLPSGPVRLAVQSWSKTALSATVPGVRNAGHESVVLIVTRGSSPMFLKGDANSSPRLGATTPPSTTNAGSVLATSGRSRVTSLPPNEATVEFWPEVERRTVTDTIVNRSCAFPACLNPGEREDSSWSVCSSPCGDHEEASRFPSGVNANGWHWLHSGDDVWIVTHPAGWHVEGVNFGRALGTSFSAGQPQEPDVRHTIVTVHWQDIAHVTGDDGGHESGPWFFAIYGLSVTMVGPKGTWP